LQIAAASLIRDLRGLFDGRVKGPDDEGYDEARTVFYGGIDRRPAAIVRPADAAGVSRVVVFARDAGLPLAVRSGGHSLAGHSVCDGGIVLDLGDLRSLDIDAEARTAWAGSGLTTGEYTAGVGAHGLATGFGDAATVGIAGITLGGGVGYLVRRDGLTIDQLIAAQIVTADGTVLNVDGSNHPDLFWAIRGGGGNFGVVTRFRFRLHDVSSFVGGMLILPATPALIRAFVAHADAAPEELSIIANVMPAPPMPFVPAEHHGKLVVFALTAFAGAVDAAQRALAPFRALATPIADAVGPMPYAKIFPPEEPGFHPIATVRTFFSDDLDLDDAGLMVERLAASTADMRVAQLRVLGGAVSRVARDATAYAHRDRRIMVNIAALYQNRDEQAVHDAWAADFATALNGGDRAAYVNFLAAADTAHVRDAYPGATWSRLVDIKRRYDPTNVFRLNHNIPPDDQRR
jgi:FAD/FMN-containing dehydrogenase